MDSTEIKVNLLHEIDCIEVTKSNGVKRKYPYVWLRDNCECSQCRYHNFKNQRKLTALDLDLDTKVEEYQLDRNLDCLVLRFSDGHQMSCQLDWLEKNSFSQENNQRVKRHGRLATISWGKEYMNYIYQEDYNKVLMDDEVLLELISTLEVRGIAVLTGAPREHGVLDKLNLRLGNISSTLFTPGPACMKFFLDKDSEYDVIDYGTEPLQLHTDLSYTSNHPVLQLLHAICQPEGVINQVVDGKMIVDVLNQKYPEALRILSTVHVEHLANYTGVYDIRAVSGVPIITLDAEGELVSINFSNEKRALGLSCKAEDCKAFYKALKTFMQVIKENTIDMVLPEGCILVLDNDRVMHGRAKFHLKTSCHRHLDVSYTDIDAMMSKKRLIQEKIQKENLH